jgi:glutamate/tyrosine decarboxylase-like PLP-dependent enzyme
VATAWAAMRHIGMHGYCDITKAMIEAAEDFAALVRTVPELQIMGSPIMTVVAFKSIKRTFDIYQVPSPTQFILLLEPMENPNSVASLVLLDGIALLFEHIACLP